jgi:hypothetical protein
MAGVADAGCKSDGGTTIALVPSWRERTPNASSTAAIDVLDTLAPPLLTSREREQPVGDTEAELI